MSSIELTQKPGLAPGVRMKTDPVTGDPVLLYPEGFLVLNATAYEIVHRCDGKKSVAEIVQELADEFDASEDILRTDILENLEQLRQKNLLSFHA